MTTKRLLTEEHTKYAMKRGWAECELKAIGVYSGVGPLIGKICFPLTTYTGAEIGVVARNITGKKEYVFRFWEQFWSYFVWKPKDNDKTIVLCEGPFDLGWILSNGFNGAAYLGSGLNQAQAKVISRFYDNVIFIPDNDVAGLNGYKRSEIMLERMGVNVFSLRTIGCKDVSELCETYPKEAGTFFAILKDRMQKIKTADLSTEFSQGMDL